MRMPFTGQIRCFAENVRFEYDKIVSRKNKVVRKLVAGVKTKMKASDVAVLKAKPGSRAEAPRESRWFATESITWETTC